MACMGEKRKADRNLVSLQEISHLEGLSVDGKILICGRARTGFIWLRIRRTVEIL